MEILHAFKQLWHFGWQQALSCIFPVIIFGTLAITQWIPLPFFARYDWLFIIFFIVQWVFVKTKIETKDEVKVITLFHLIGLNLELFKVHMGSWSYPEEGFFKMMDVPLYSGFMYASVASYLCQAWRRMNVELVNFPPLKISFPLTAAIYFNFFTHHFFVDLRWILSLVVVIVFWKSWVKYHVNGVQYKMPIVCSFFLIGLFVWIAENIATFFGAWQYPNQVDTWSLVHIGKVSSWVLLVIVSFLIVAILKTVKKRRNIFS